MSWFRVDDHAAFAAKVVAAGNEAFGAWTRAGAWSSGELTDGFIPEHVALTIAPRKIWDRLRDAKAGHEHGLVEEREGGWQIHNFNKRNPTAASVRAEREATKRRVDGWREKRKRNGVTTTVTNGVTNGVVTPDETPPPSHTHQIPPKPPQGGEAQTAPLVLASEQPKASKRRRKAPETSLPDGWAPKPAHYRTGVEQGFDRAGVDHQAERFKARALAKAATYADWDQAFRNWLLSDLNQPGSGQGRPQRAPIVEPAPGGNDRIFAEMERLRGLQPEVQ